MLSFKKIYSGVKKFMFPTRGFKTIKVQSNVVPFGLSKVGAASKVAKGAGSVIKSLYEGVKSFTTKKTINPAAGVTGGTNILKTLGKAAGTGALVGGIFQSARIISKAGVTGETPKISDVTKSITKGATTGAGLGLSPLGGLLGAGEGAGILTANQVKSKVQDIFGMGQSRIEDATNIFSSTYKNASDSMPTIPSLNIYNSLPESFTPQDIIPSSPQAVYIESPQVPSYTSPSFSPSFSVGGGGGLSESLPLLMLMGAGLGGFALGRRKRKKKKYKKRKKH